jgi:hypothetical protein
MGRLLPNRWKGSRSGNRQNQEISVDSSLIAVLLFFIRRIFLFFDFGSLKYEAVIEGHHALHDH